MISAGWFGVSEKHLRKLGKVEAEKFIFEMYTCGGRIGHHEYQLWLTWIKINL